jgi:ABC-type arginine/histidine transport system permease subunit
MSNNTDIEELSGIEKIIKLFSLSLLIGSFLLTLFFQQGRNILDLVIPSGFYWFVYFYIQDVQSNNETLHPRFYKPTRFFLIILCMLYILSNFMVIAQPRKIKLKRVKRC